MTQNGILLSIQNTHTFHIILQIENIAISQHNFSPVFLIDSVMFVR